MGSQFNARTAESAAAAYATSRANSQFLSIAHGIRAIRTLMPSCEASDRELADMIAAAAIIHGTPVSFDGITSTKNMEAAIDAPSRALETRK